MTGTRDKAAAREKKDDARNGSKAQGPTGSGIHVNGKPAGSVPPTAGKTGINKAGGASGQSAGADVPSSTGESLEQSVFRSLEQYFDNLDGAKPHALHEMVLGAIEKPLLQFALHRCAGNQSAAADLLGINRNTLRRKLQDYGLH
jgi:Fis family transcriptional regulator